MTKQNHLYLPTGALVFETLNTTAISIRLSDEIQIFTIGTMQLIYPQFHVQQQSEIRGLPSADSTPHIYREWSLIQNTQRDLRLGPCESSKIDLLFPVTFGATVQLFNQLVRDIFSGLTRESQNKDCRNPHLPPDPFFHFDLNRKHYSDCN